MGQTELYCGRFAPSPTGDLHMGSLVAALASYCQAKANQGMWLLRIEDVDTSRSIPGAAEQLIKTLNKFGMTSDKPVVYQSHPERQQAYQEALSRLTAMQLTYRCECTRSTLRTHSIYPGTCRIKHINQDTPTSIRLKTNNTNFVFNDLIQGGQTQNPHRQCGDFNIKRKDGLFCYQLAVVVDDAAQGITEVVRGIDIMDSTGRQMYLNHLLSYKQPSFAHIPIIVDNNGNKLSKQNHAKSITHESPYDTTKLALKMLGQHVPQLKKKTQSALLNWAIENWQPSQMAGIQTIS